MNCSTRDVRDDVNFVWADSLRALTIIEADLYMDLLFELDNERTSRLKQLLSKPVLVNAVPYTTNTIGQDFTALMHGQHFCSAISWKLPCLQR